MKKVKPDSIFYVTATLSSQDSNDPTDGLSNVTLELFYDGQLHRTLTPVRNGTKYSCPISFPVYSELGEYTAKWSFDFHGEVITKEEVILLESKSVAKIEIGFDTVTDIDKAKFVQANAGIFPLMRPSAKHPKFDQQYSQYTAKTSFQHQSCESCMHFIPQSESASGSTPNQCQLVNNEPIEISYEGWCRLWRDNYQLEGYILFKPVVEETISEPEEYVDIVEVPLESGDQVQSL